MDREIALQVKRRRTLRRIAKRDGRGLGLTVVQEILGRHGFEFSLEGRPEGGAEFRIGFGGG